jgi:AcrR family transcriptional regulator
MDAIAQAAGSQKMSIYRLFPSKAALVFEWLTALAAEHEQDLSDHHRRHLNDPRGEILGLADIFAGHDGARARAARLLASTGLYIDDAGPDGPLLIQAACRDLLGRLETLCASLDLPAPANLAWELAYVLEGARSFGALHPDADAPRRLRQLLERLLEQAGGGDVPERRAA